MKSFLILLFIALLQNASAQITVTMLSDLKEPMVGETIEFASEEKEVLASCMTTAGGRCTMILQDVLTDASGHIRGTLITGRGQRPIIFKGELFEITLTLDETDQLSIPSDAYVTRTPQNSPQPKATVTTTTQPETTVTTTTQPETIVTTTTQPETTAVHAPLATATTTTQPEMTAPAPEENNLRQPSDRSLYFWLQLGLIIILITAAMIYIWVSQKQDNP